MKSLPWLLLLVTACATGEQVSNPCPRSCALGERRCGYDTAVQVCIEGAEAACPEWSEPFDCPPQSACLEGTCGVGCTDACDPGETACANGGVQVCGDVEADGCRDWTEPMPCVGDGICDEGQCVASGCEDQCTPGETECVEGGLRVCEDSESCADWSPATACPAMQICMGGACPALCEDACVDGARRCDAAGSSVCGAGEDGCTEWDIPTVCEPGERCDDGACVSNQSACTDGCAADGAVECAGEDAIRRCGQYDADPCLELSDAVPCGGLEVCAEGACAPSCDDTCAPAEVRCIAGARVTCGEFDGDPCLEWSRPDACEAGESCDDGRCIEDIAPCADACEVGAIRCVPAGVQRCGDQDADPCLEWMTPVACAVGEVCRGAGVCEADCVDECAMGERRCVNGGVALCNNVDADLCLEFGAPSICPNGQACSDGMCTLQCVNDCAAGQTACAPDGERRCGDFDADDCRDWSSPVPCGPGEGCVSAACASICADDCDAGTQRCDGARLATCADGNGDGCVEWTPPVECAPGAACSDGVCRALPVNDALFNEVYYDAPGADQATVFIELSGPPGLSLDDVRIIGINGANGETYGEIELMGLMPANGLLVIAHPDAEPALLAVADLIDPQADLQNGPDSVILARGAVFVDNLSYGDFGAGGNFVGQGEPALEPGNGQSLQRVGQTDNNRNDYVSGPPTPGALGCADACALDTVRCLGSVTQRCVRGANACTGWSATRDCAATGEACNQGVCGLPD
ncbi:MAG: hypothetical protein ACI9U2_000172 [Bradymonadia bacterium]|jgi:hypothetical protein